jgi:HisJ family histidinol phosphate phosphatase
MEMHDDHMHLRAHNHPPPPHALAPMLTRARATGIVPGFREHPTLPAKFRLGPYADFDYAMRDFEVEPFLQMFADEKVPLGLEVDFLDGEMDEIKSGLDMILSRAAQMGVPVSGVNGSVHLLPGDVWRMDWPRGNTKHIIWDLDENVFVAHLKDRGPKQLLHDYFGAMLDLAAAGIYDNLSHIDLIRKYDRRNQSGDSIYFSEVEKLFMSRSRKVVERVSEAGMAMEINTAGMFAPLGRPYITQEILNYAVELGVPVCMGADAHVPERIGAGLDVALKMLEAAGRDYAVTFEARKAKRYFPRINTD